MLAGPWATQLLGDFGADVVKVERPGSGDDTRRWGPPWMPDATGESAYFLGTNRAKRSLTVDLASTAGQQLVRELAARADVVIENFRVGTTARFGIDYAALEADNPQLVYCTISSFAQSSSQAARPGYDAMIQAGGGLMSITGAADGEPQKVGVAIADIMTGMYAANAILAALYARANGAGGQHVEVPLFDSQVAWLANQNMNYLIGGQVPTRSGSAHPNIVPYQVFATRDGHVMLAVGNDRQFRRCTDALGVQGLADDARYASNAARVENRDALVAELAAIFREADTAEWIARLEQHDVPCSPINTIRDVFESDYAREARLCRHQAHALNDALPTVSNPVRFSRTPVAYDRAPPLLGEHSDEVLRDWLGYSAQQIEQLRRTGAI